MHSLIPHAGLHLMMLCIISCGSGTTPVEAVDLSLSEHYAGGVIYGVVEQRTDGAAIANVQVTVSLGSLFTKSALTLEDGSFAISGLASGRYTLRIDAAGFALHEAFVDVAAGIQDAHFVAAGEKGRIMLDLPCAVTALIEGNGTPIVGVPVAAYAYSQQELHPTHARPRTDETGHVTFDRLRQDTYYTLRTPVQDTDDDGAYDLSAGFQSVFCNATAMTTTVHVVSTTNGFTEQLQQATLWHAPGDWDTAFRAGQPIRIFFRFPVTLAFDDSDGGFLLSTTRNLVLSTDPAHGLIEQVPIKATLSADRTILTIIPELDLREHAFFQLRGIVHTAYTGATKIVSVYAAQTIPLFDEWGLESITADNYNDSNQSDTAQAVYLEFPEQVTGVVHVVATTDASADPSTVAQAHSANFYKTSYNDNASLVLDEQDGGCRSDNEATCTDHGDVRFRIHLGVELADHTAEHARTVTVRIDVNDTEGHNIRGELTLPVQ